MEAAAAVFGEADRRGWIQMGATIGRAGQGVRFGSSAGGMAGGGRQRRRGPDGAMRAGDGGRVAHRFSGGGHEPMAYPVAKAMGRGGTANDE